MNFEINHIGDILIGAVNTEDMYEGRMVTLTSHSWDKDFGSLTDLPGCRYPVSTAEATLSHYVVAWPEDQRSLPIYQAQPAYSWALRQGWDQASNVPFSATVYTTHPQNMETQAVIPSGFGVKLFGQGCIVTVPSGAYVHSASLETPGAPLAVTSNGGDKGKVFYSTQYVVAEVVTFNTDSSLTFRVK